MKKEITIKDIYNAVRILKKNDISKDPIKMRDYLRKTLKNNKLFWEAVKKNMIRLKK